MDINTYARTATINWIKPTIDPKSFESLEDSTAIRPFQYLEFAEKDLRLGGLRGLVNALGNAKRAIDCQMTNILRALGLPESDSFPAKISHLASLGIVTPRIVSKVNRSRNALEHDYHRPTPSAVEDAVDVATLFLETLRPFTSGAAYMSTCWVADDASANPWPARRANGMTFWHHREVPKYTFSEGIYVNSDLKTHTVHLELIRANRELAQYTLTPGDARFGEIQAFLLKCRPENRQHHSRRGAREFLSILARVA